MRRILLLFALGLSWQRACAGPWSVPTGAFVMSPSVFFYSAQRQFSSSGSLTHLFFEGTFRETVLTLYGEWGVSKDLTLVADFPVAHVEFEARDSTHAYTRSLTQPSYAGLNVRYACWRFASTVATVEAGIHVPPGFHHGLFDDPNHVFLSDGFLEGTAGLEVGSTFLWGWIEAAAVFHARGEEAMNQMEFRGVVGLASQRRVRMKLTFVAMKTLGHLPQEPVDVERTSTAEDYLWTDCQVMFSLTDRVAVGGSLGLRVLGAHTLSLNGGGVSVTF